MNEPETRATLSVPILLAALSDDSQPSSLAALRAALAGVAAADFEVVEAGSLDAAGRALRERRFAAVFFHPATPGDIRAALAVAVDGAAHGSAAAPVIFVTPAAGDVARLAALEPRLVVDVLDPALASLLVPLKLHACATTFRTEAALRGGVDAARHAAERHLATVAHDLRNPLNTVLLAAQRVEILADQRADGAAICKSTVIIARAVERMSRLVGDLLDLARLDGGQSLPLEWEEVDLLEQLRQAAELIEPQATARRLRLEIDTSGSAAHARTLCDPERLQQVLANLLGNAIKFTREGGAITLRLGADAGGVVVSVTDTGIGIPRAQLPEIFTAFWQRDTQHKRGAGLGLAIAKAIADAHGGSLDVDSTEGVGTTFSLRIPHRAAAPAGGLELR